MNNAELKEALFNQRPVIAILEAPTDGEFCFECVSAIIYRINNGKLNVIAELSDKNGDSVTIVKPSQIRYKED